MAETTIYLLIGEDDYLANAKAREIAYRLVPADQRDFGLEILDAHAAGSEEALAVLRQAEESLRTRGFLAERKVVWLRDANVFCDNRISKTDDVKNAVAALTASVKEGWPAGHVLLATAGKVDKRQVFYKACQAQKAQIQEFAIPDKAGAARKHATDHLRLALRQTGVHMDERAQAAFVEKVGADTRQIFNEVHKLSAYLGERRAAGLSDIAEIVCASRETPAWDLLDAVGERKLGPALRLLRQLLFNKSKENPIGLVHFLASRIQELIIYRQGLDRGWLKPKPGRTDDMTWGALPESAQRVFSEDLRTNPVSMHPFRISQLARQARNFSMRELTEAYRKTVAACEQLVTGHSSDRLPIEMLLIDIIAKNKKTA
jgi:DNA polymerase III subunit delta